MPFFRSFRPLPSRKGAGGKVVVLHASDQIKGEHYEAFNRGIDPSVSLALRDAAFIHNKSCDALSFIISSQKIRIEFLGALRAKAMAENCIRML